MKRPNRQDYEFSSIGTCYVHKETGELWEDHISEYIDHLESELDEVKVELADKEDKLNKSMQLLASTDAELKQIVRKMLTPGMGSIQEDATKAALLKEFEKLAK